MKNKMANVKKVKMLGKDGSVIAVFATIKQAENATGVPSANISACCQGRLYSAGGFKWAYAAYDDEIKEFPVQHACNIEFDSPRLPLTYKFIVNHRKRALEAVAWAREKYSDLDDVLTALSGEDVEVTGYEQIKVAFDSGFEFSLPAEELTDEFLLKLTRLIISCSTVSEISGDWYRGVYDGQYVCIEKNVDSTKNAI